eukprot:10363917-Alexandrium_andersonii.AAC.1
MRTNLLGLWTCQTGTGFLGVQATWCGEGQRSWSIRQGIAWPRWSSTPPAHAEALRTCEARLQAETQSCRAALFKYKLSNTCVVGCAGVS